MERNNKGTIIAIICGVVAVGVLVFVGVMLIFNQRGDSLAPVAPGGDNPGQTTNPGGNKPGTNPGGSTTTPPSGNENENPGGTTTPPKDDNSLSSLIQKYPNATTSELNQIKTIRETYKNANDTTIVKNLLTKKDYKGACLFLENGNPNVTSILKEDFSKYYSPLVGSNCLNRQQQNEIKTIVNNQMKEQMKTIKERIGQQAKQTCYKYLNENEIVTTSSISFTFEQIDISEVAPLPFENLETGKQVDLKKSTVKFSNRCVLQSVTIVDVR